jgi:hypothetical protein
VPPKHPIVEFLCAYDQGRLSSADGAPVERHLAGCTACCLRLDELPDDDRLALLLRETGFSARHTASQPLSLG